MRGFGFSLRRHHAREASFLRSAARIACVSFCSVAKFRGTQSFGACGGRENRRDYARGFRIRDSPLDAVSRRFSNGPPRSPTRTLMFRLLIFLPSLALLLGAEGIVVRPEAPGKLLNFTYHDHGELEVALRQISSHFPDLTSLYSIGKSAKNKELWVLRVTSPHSSILGTPNVKFVGNIHGNEPVGRELILHLAEFLVTSYATDDEAKWLLDNTIFHLLPGLNPDGFEESVEGDCESTSGRGNGNFVDLNRSFPDYFRENGVSRQPETVAVMKWMSRIHFVLSASFHGGTLVANYPYENAPKTEDENFLPRYSASPDDDTFKHLAETYAKNHLTMHKGDGCRDGSSVFPGGITNGAAWYKITGGMQDYNYIWHGCMELTLEISCCKYPERHHLPRLWVENKKAMLEWAKQAHVGVRGMVMDTMTGSGISSASLKILGRDANFTSAQSGEFWRILLPGDYTLKVEAEGYKPQLFPFTVREADEIHPRPTWLNIYLRRMNISMAETSGGGFPSFRFSPYLLLIGTAAVLARGLTLL